MNTLTATVAAALAAPLLAFGAGVSVRMDASSPATTPFPSDRFTQVDWTQNTFRRVNLPKPDCAVRVSDLSLIHI